MHKLRILASCPGNNDEERTMIKQIRNGKLDVQIARHVAAIRKQFLQLGSTIRIGSRS